MFANLLPKGSLGSICLLCVIGTFSPSIAQAGFEWTPPRAAPAAQEAPVVHDAAPVNGPLTPEPDSDSLPVPVGNVEAAPVTRPETRDVPLVVENTRPAPTPAPAPVAEKVEELPMPAPEPQPEPEPVAAPAPAPMVRPAPVAVAPTPAPTPAPAPTSADVIEGFGKDIPLAIALRDIVPAKYAYAFSPNNIAGTKISWRGGKVWQDVLTDALAPVGLAMQITDTTVVIFSGNTPIPSASVAPAPAPEAPHTMVAARPAAMDANAEPLPLVSSQDAQDQERIAAGNNKPAAPAVAAPAEKPPVMSAMDLKATRKWQARPGTTLRQTLEAWSKESNVELNWSTPYDYPISNAFYFDGQFTQAVDSLLASFGGQNPSPKGRLYPNLPEGPSVLMVN